MSNPHLAPKAESATLGIQPISHEVLLEKYAKGDERSVDDVRRARRARARRRSRRRAARAMGGALPRGAGSGFIPAGRINSAAGTALGATLINCFVQPVGDSIAEPSTTASPASTPRCTEAAETMRRGGGVGYDFSRIRPQGRLGRAHALARSGPVSLHARVRPLVRDGGVGRRAARRADGRAALRPSRHRGLHPRQGRRRPHQLQHLGRRDRRVHARGRGRRASSNWCTAPSRARRRRPPARTSAATACGSTASCARATCGTRSCARPTTTPSRASCSSTA